MRKTDLWQCIIAILIDAQISKSLCSTALCMLYKLVDLLTRHHMELSFVDIDDVIEVNERLLKHLFKEVINVDVEIPFKSTFLLSLRFLWISGRRRSR